MSRPVGSKNRPKIKQVIQQVDEKIDFQNNPRLKQAGVQHQWTEEEVAEFRKCAADEQYFVETYVNILAADSDELQAHPLWAHQKRALASFIKNRFTIFLCPRQCGKTTVVIGHILHYILFQTHKTVGILAQKEKTAQEIMRRIQMSYERLPMFLQQGVIEWNKTSILIENGCRVLSESTSSGAIRGFTLNLLYLDEFAHVPQNIAEDFFTSVWPTISRSKVSQVIITSTPNGLNLFYRFWTEAEKQLTDPAHWNGFVAVRAYYNEVPGQDEAWADLQLRVMKERKFNQEVACEFLGSSNTLISGKRLRELVFREPLRLMFDDQLAIYEDPRPEHAYVLTADTSEGKGQDYQAFSVFDVTEDTWRQVARFHDNTIDEILFASYIYQMALHYNSAYTVVENNEMGGLVLRQLIEDLEYENVFYTTVKLGDQAATQSLRAKTPGVKSNKRTKAQGCARLKLLIENRQLQTVDFETIQELSTFALNKIGSYAAEDGYHDDIAMTCVLFAWFSNQSVFREIADLNLRQKLHQQRIQASESQLPIAVEITSPKYKEPPKLEVQQGQLWIDSSMSIEQAIDIIRESGWVNNDKPEE